MENRGIEYPFSGKVLYNSSSGSNMDWYMAFLPEEMSKEIRENLEFLEEG
ncbi:MAG: hypothetical protein LUD15_01185 [Bacteroides sp.]|nr:hypothetical protein [Bacteroides sp.]